LGRHARSLLLPVRHTPISIQPHFLWSDNRSSCSSPICSDAEETEKAEETVEAPSAFDEAYKPGYDATAGEQWTLEGTEESSGFTQPATEEWGADAEAATDAAPVATEGAPATWDV
jgi:hypothetical protein